MAIIEVPDMENEDLRKPSLPAGIYEFNCVKVDLKATKDEGKWSNSPMLVFHLRADEGAPIPGHQILHYFVLPNPDVMDQEQVARQRREWGKIQLAFGLDVSSNRDTDDFVGLSCRANVTQEQSRTDPDEMINNVKYLLTAE